MGKTAVQKLRTQDPGSLLTGPLAMAVSAAVVWWLQASIHPQSVATLAGAIEIVILVFTVAGAVMAFNLLRWAVYGLVIVSSAHFWLNSDLTMWARVAGPVMLLGVAGFFWWFVDLVNAPLKIHGHLHDKNYPNSATAWRPELAKARLVLGNTTNNDYEDVDIRLWIPGFEIVDIQEVNKTEGVSFVVPHRDVEWKNSTPVGEVRVRIDKLLRNGGSVELVMAVSGTTQPTHVCMDGQLRAVLMTRRFKKVDLAAERQDQPVRLDPQ